MRSKAVCCGHGYTVSRKARKLLAASAIAVACATVAIGVPAQNVAAVGDSRTLSLYNVHTKENLTVTYKKNGRYIPSAMKKLNYFLRDFRRNEPTRMDPELIDLVYELHEELGSRKPVHVISGYRSPKTNAMLKSIGRNVAKRSQHIQGRAMDIYFPDVNTKKVRNSALVRKVGGVGYYPHSGKYGFVHVDTARVRHWPGIPKAEYAAIFANHKTQVAQARRKAAEQAEPVLASAPPRPREKPAALAAIALAAREKEESGPLTVAQAPVPEPRPEEALASANTQVAMANGDLRVEPAAAQPAERQSFADPNWRTGGGDFGPLFSATRRRVASDPSLDPPVIEPLSTLASSSTTGDLDPRGQQVAADARGDRDDVPVTQASATDTGVSISILPPIIDGLKRLFASAADEPTILDETDLGPVGGQTINRAGKGDLIVSNPDHVTPNAAGKAAQLGQTHASLTVGPAAALRSAMRERDPLDPAPLPFD